ncbi:MAG: SDR family oxidoreductase [Deltaproteobacteria bacterium]|nr:SDR family oxidoreductase [Deltaproteobacteria bacterium]MBW2253801.1 SDR family oxidoreductase [Deltaproteobacteria bacterium]
MSARWIAILGASSGFGAATAREFAAAGHPVFGAHLDRRGTMPQVTTLIEALRGHQVPVLFHNGNAADDTVRGEAIDRLAGAIEDAGGGTVGVLLHSLAFGTLRPFFDEGGRAMTRRQLEMTLDVMANSLVYWTQDLLQRGLLREGSRIFAMTSSGSVAAWPSYGAVSAAKSALESHIRQIAVELSPRGISANAIMAGVTPTPALEKIPGHEEIEQRARLRNPSGRLTRPEDVARCILALSAPGAAWMTGNTIRVDGGEAISG